MMNSLKAWTTIGRVTSKQWNRKLPSFQSALPLLPTSKVSCCSRPSYSLVGGGHQYFASSSFSTEQEPQALNIQVVSDKKSKSKAVRVCYGCGADIVPKNHQEAVLDDSSNSNNKKKDSSFQVATSSKKKSSYWETQKELLRVSKIKNWSLCSRCKALSKNSNMANAGPSTELAREAFRRQVKKIKTQHAVVVVVVDAINVAGTMLKTVREYCGGNPILLAVTRCDLLPPYYGISTTHCYEEEEEEDYAHAERLARIKRDFAKRAKDWNVAEVFMISLPPNKNRKNHHTKSGGVAQLAAALLEKRMNRDVFVVGAANIGKSTLTDALVDELIAQQSLGAFLSDPLSAKRVDAIREMRVTQSALPGTTLQNIRIPCFVNHEQALWDTPGLLVDVSRHHFPIVGLEEMQRSAPLPIQPIDLSCREKKFEVHLYDRKDDIDKRLPLLRMVVRLKKEKKDDDNSSVTCSPSTRLVWNSVFGLEAKVFDESNPPPPLPSKLTTTTTTPTTTTTRNHQDGSERGSSNDDKVKPLITSTQDKHARKEERRRARQARIKAEQEELGMNEWKRQQREKEAQLAAERRRNLLLNLDMVKREKISANDGTDITIANLGWFSLLCDSRDVLVEVFAPSTGVIVRTSPSVALPHEWDWQGSAADDEADELPDDVDSDWDDDSRWTDVDSEWDDDDISIWNNIDHDWDDNTSIWNDSDHDWDNDDESPDDKAESTSGKGFANDPWANFAGPAIGWEFLDDTRWSKGKLEEGWHRIRQHRDLIDDPDSIQNEPEWKEPLQQHYRIVYPEQWREDGDNRRRGQSGRKKDKGRSRWQRQGKASKSSKGLSKKQRKNKGDVAAPW